MLEREKLFLTCLNQVFTAPGVREQEVQDILEQEPTASNTKVMCCNLLNGTPHPSPNFIGVCRAAKSDY
jgi:hypothetical protein